MGEVIGSKAAADDIFADIETTFARAAARGGKWKEIAELRLSAVRGVVAALQARLGAAETEFLPLKAAIDAHDKHSDQVIGKLSDEIWNAIGRPAFDPTFDVVFPGGIAHYTEGANEEQPDRMELLAELLEMRLIGKLDPAFLTTAVQLVREEATSYRKVVEAAAQPRLKVQQLQRAKTAVAQSARMELAHLKRLYKAEGFSEADIHGVIPDRPRPRKAAAAIVATPPNPNQPAPTA
jgi:hypothetical protein